MIATGIFAHPLTGELLEATDQNLRDARRAGHDERSRILLALAPIQAELADRAGPAVLPERRYRSPLQETVAACGRCGRPLEGGAPAGTERDT